MANIDSDLYTLEVAAAADTSQSPNAHAYGGAVFVKECKLTVTGTVLNDTLRLFHLPAGSRVVPALSKVQCNADPGTTLTLDIGTATTLDLFADGIVLDAGGAVSFDSTVSVQAVTPTRLAARTLIQAKAVGLDTIGSGKTLTFWVAYTL